jgi:hypothetical protein
MKVLIFELFTVSILLCNVYQDVVGQNSQTNGKYERNHIEMHSAPGVDKKSPFYIMSNMDKVSEFRRTRFAYPENSGKLYANSIYLTRTDSLGYYVQTSGNINTSAYDTYSDLHFELEPESSNKKLELVRKLDPRLYQLNLRSYTASPKKNDFRIAEQLLLILLQENQRKSHQ